MDGISALGYRKKRLKEITISRRLLDVSETHVAEVSSGNNQIKLNNELGIKNRNCRIQFAGADFRWRGEPRQEALLLYCRRNP